MKANELIVLGAGGHAKVAIATLIEAGFHPTAVYDDNPKLAGQSLLGIPLKGTISSLSSNPEQIAFIAIGDNKIRKSMSEKLSMKWVNAIHPRAWIHSSVELGSGILVCANCVIHPSSQIGSHSIINTSASIDHDNKIGAFVHIGPGAHTGGTVEIGEGTFVGMGANIIHGKKIGSWSMIGAGAAVVDDIGSNLTALGVPARIRS